MPVAFVVLQILTGFLEAFSSKGIVFQPVASPMRQSALWIFSCDLTHGDLYSLGDIDKAHRMSIISAVYALTSFLLPTGNLMGVCQAPNRLSIDHHLALSPCWYVCMQYASVRAGL